MTSLVMKKEILSRIKHSDNTNWSDLIENIEEFLKDLDDWDETKNDLPVNPGSLETLLMSNDNMLLKLAPGEGRTPLNIIQHQLIEELAYPCVFVGVKRDLHEDLTILKKSMSDILRLVSPILFYYNHIHINLFFHPVGTIGGLALTYRFSFSSTKW